MTENRYEVGPGARSAGLQSPALFRRFELKFHLPEHMIPRIHELSAPYVDRDPFAAETANGHYTVRSVYYDSPDLMCFHEKLDGVKTRKKLRVRAYTYGPDQNSDKCWFEIKRKLGRLSLKERVSVPIEDAEVVLGESVPNAILDTLDYRSRAVLDKFKFNIRARKMRAVVLVTYDREPFIGRDRRSNRITFDRKIRSLFDPSLHNIFQDQGLRQFEEERFVLEMKFDDRMPAWMARIIQELNIRAQAYSKFCEGITAWLPME
jgi:hypothetical protein